ncbi:transposase [Clostridium gasigenes]|nr:transposase [Clostridium gasigenes]MBU3135986.1 transposase [Clostridium gasigenes]
MDNHVHLIIKTETEALASIMRRINSIYTRYFNGK